MFAPYPKEVKLKDDRKVTIRPMTREDGPGLLKFFKSLRRQDLLYMRDDITDPDVIQKWVDNLDYDHVFPLLAINEKKQIIADASLHRNTHGWSRHVGQIRVAVHHDYQGAGLGYHMAREIFVIAQSMQIDKVLAEMMDVQVGAVKVFTKLGFHKEHVFKNHVRDHDDKLHGLVVMSVDINEIMTKWEEAVREFEDRGG